jgi:hypothetical protein
MNAFKKIWLLAKRSFVQCWFVALLGGGMFGRGLYTGIASISIGHATVQMVYAARATSPVKFWLIECAWLSCALCLAFYGTRDLIRFRRGLPEEPQPRHAVPLQGLMPEALAELVHTQRIREESVPRLLKEMRPQLRPSDSAPVLHRHGIEWTGVILGAVSVVAMIVVLLVWTDPYAWVVTVMLFGAFAIVFPVSFILTAASWRRRRRKQMEWILESEARHRSAHPPSDPAPVRSAYAPPVPTIAPKQTGP